jgi:hypothetical protein
LSLWLGFVQFAAASVVVDVFVDTTIVIDNATFGAAVATAGSRLTFTPGVGNPSTTQALTNVTFICSGIIAFPIELVAFASLRDVSFVANGAGHSPSSSPRCDVLGGGFVMAAPNVTRCSIAVAGPVLVAGPIRVMADGVNGNAADIAISVRDGVRWTFPVVGWVHLLRLRANAAYQTRRPPDANPSRASAPSGLPSTARRGTSLSPSTTPRLPVPPPRLLG